MRLRRLINRAQWVGGCASLFLVGIYVGRLSLTHAWIESWSIAIYLFSCLVWLLPIYREHKRSEREFRRVMRQLEVKWRMPRL